MKRTLPLITLALLSACASSSGDMQTPTGIGPGPDKLQPSPCACNRVDTENDIPEFMKAQAE